MLAVLLVSTLAVAAAAAAATAVAGCLSRLVRFLPFQCATSFVHLPRRCLNKFYASYDVNLRCTLRVGFDGGRHENGKTGGHLELVFSLASAPAPASFKPVLPPIPPRPSARGL